MGPHVCTVDTVFTSADIPRDIATVNSPCPHC
jgi:hypothetical protein